MQRDVLLVFRLFTTFTMRWLFKSLMIYTRFGMFASFKTKKFQS